jgi:hypothetical protein
MWYSQYLSNKAQHQDFLREAAQNTLRKEARRYQPAPIPLYKRLWAAWIKRVSGMVQQRQQPVREIPAAKGSLNC